MTKGQGIADGKMGLTLHTIEESVMTPIYSHQQVVKFCLSCIYFESNFFSLHVALFFHLTRTGKITSKIIHYSSGTLQIAVTQQPNKRFPRCVNLLNEQQKKNFNGIIMHTIYCD